jgi:hypothetical protein
LATGCLETCTSRILKKEYPTIFWHGIFSGLLSSQYFPQKKRKKKEKQIATLIGPLAMPKIEIIYICVCLIFHFVFAFSLYIIVKIPWQI